MPSLHIAWATWVAITVWQLVPVSGLPRWVRLPAVGYPVVTTVAVVTTANHYLLDVFAGVAVATLAVGIANGYVRSLFTAPAPAGRPEPAVAQW
jgi:membrane-associated phospholipid phosphatase